MIEWLNNRRARGLVIILGFVLILFYETAQQYYYVTTFDLANGREVIFEELLASQFIKWLAWIFLSIPFIRYIQKFPIGEEGLKFSDTARYFCAILVMLVFNILVISIMHVFANGIDIRIPIFIELTIFYTFQKGPIYMLAYIGVIIWVHLFLNQEELKLTVKELYTLKDSNRLLYEELRKRANTSEPFTINVKIGNKWKVVLLEEINWIEADDYCVKLHLTETTYTQRTSMKSLEDQLPRDQFIRIHRKSIININNIEEVQFSHDPRIKLKSGESLSIAQSRIRDVKQALSMKNSQLAI
ncbi:MAG: LytTR family transcriptional regulator DNA-binding domain-containing protein [Bacteroidota bacterium]